MAYTAKCDTAVHTKWWITGTGSTVNRLSEVMDDNPLGVEENDNPGNYQLWSEFMTEHIENVIYQIHQNLEIGDGSTSTTLLSDSEYVYFDDDMMPYVKAQATLTIEQSFWSIAEVTTAAYFNFGDGGTIDISYSLWENRYYKTFLAFNSGTVTLKEVIFFYKGKIYFASGLTSYTIADVTFKEISSIPFAKAPVSISNMKGYRVTTNFSISAGNSVTVEGTIIEDHQGTDYWYVAPNATLTERNPAYTTDITKITWGSSGTNTYIEEYGCDIHVADKDGADLASASVACEYAHLVEGSDSKTYKCIADHTAVDADHKPITGTDWADYWELYNASGGDGGDWDTGFAYKSGTAGFTTQTTASDGTITQQWIERRRAVGVSAASTITQRIYKFTLSKSGYETLVLDNVTVDGAIDWHLELKDIDVNEMQEETFMIDTVRTYLDN